MSNIADGPTIPRYCSERFERLTTIAAEHQTALDGVSKKLDTLCIAVVGNGSAENSLGYRMLKAESNLGRTKTKRQIWLDRAWQVAVAVALVAFGVWMKS